jgi:hypothetical protein
MTGPDQGRPEPGPDAGIDDITADIETTRQELGETVQALSAKLDVKERAHEKVDEAKHRVAEKADGVRQAAMDRPARTVPIALAVVGVLALIVIWRKRR